MTLNPKPQNPKTPKPQLRMNKINFLSLFVIRWETKSWRRTTSILAMVAHSLKILEVAQQCAASKWWPLTRKIRTIFTTLAILEKVHSKPCTKRRLELLRGHKQAKELEKCHKLLKELKVNNTWSTFRALSKNFRWYKRQNIESLASMRDQKVLQKLFGEVLHVS